MRVVGLAGDRGGPIAASLGLDSAYILRGVRLDSALQRYF